MPQPWRIQLPAVLGVQEASIIRNVEIAAFRPVQTSAIVRDGFGPEHYRSPSSEILRGKVDPIKPRVSQEATCPLFIWPLPIQGSFAKGSARQGKSLAYKERDLIEYFTEWAHKVPGIGHRQNESNAMGNPPPTLRSPMRSH